jgi:4-alpha-glucanotransferase
MIKKRLLGIIVPLSVLRNSNGTAVGEYPDLGEFAKICKKMKVGLIQLLPINDTGGQSSPYFGLTAFALHPLYLRISDLPEAAGFKDKAAAIDREYKDEVRFPYYKILKAKMELMQEIYKANQSAIEKSARGNSVLSKWIGQNPWVIEYSVYRRLKEIHDEKSWKEWTIYRKVTPQEITALWKDTKLRREHLFWVWLQHAADLQFSTAAKAVRDAGIVLKGDLPILMNDDSCDVWAHPEIFNQNLSAGAPPDMYSPAGQNWGFPLYNWEAQERDGYAWWKQRLAVAGKYYQAYRIDHVMGFFRIWASSPRENSNSSIMGRYIPYTPITNSDLRKLGLDKRRVSQPHIPTDELVNAICENAKNENLAGKTNIESVINEVFSKALNRIGSEEQWLFKKKIKGEKDIDALCLHRVSRPYLYEAWKNRIFIEYEKGKYFPSWHYRDSSAYHSLSKEEKTDLEELLRERITQSEEVWEAQGKKLLSMLVESSPMLACAEDLGTVPACVPRVLNSLRIPGLRVVRWEVRQNKDKKHCIPFDEYPELSVCTLSLHDSTTVREWWETEADQKLFSKFLGLPSIHKTYNPETAKAFLTKAASARSCFRIFLIQDILHLSDKWYAKDPASERINVPGTYNDFNWTYRLPVSMSEIGKNREFIKAVTALSQLTQLLP